MATRAARVLLVIGTLLGLASCSVAGEFHDAKSEGRNPATVGEAPPADSPLGAAVDSGVAGFARPEGLRFDGITIDDREDRTFQLRSNADGPALRAWLDQVYPPGQDLGDWAWCPESDDASIYDGQVIRRYANPDRGFVEVEIRLDLDGLYGVTHDEHGGCSTDVHD